MKQKERMDKKVKQERTEPDHHRKSLLRESPCMNRSGQRAVNCGTASCRAWENTEKRFFENVRYSLIFVPQLGRIQTG